MAHRIFHVITGDSRNTSRVQFSLSLDYGKRTRRIRGALVSNGNSRSVIEETKDLFIGLPFDTVLEKCQDIEKRIMDRVRLDAHPEDDPRRGGVEYKV